MRMLGGVSANGPSCSPIVSASRTESALFWRRLGSTTIIRFFKVDVAGWLNCERASTSQSHRMHWPKLSVCSLGWSSYFAQIAERERERDEVAAAEGPDRAGKMIQQLTSLRGIGVQSATVLAFARPLYDTFPMARRSAHMPALPDSL